MELYGIGFVVWVIKCGFMFSCAVSETLPGKNEH